MSKFNYFADLNVDKNDPNSPVNNSEVQKVPFEPTVSGNYVSAYQHKRIRLTMAESHKVPVDLFHKHKGLLFRSYFETPPNKDFAKKYTNFMDSIDQLAAEGKDVFEHSDLWISDLQKILPLNYTDRCWAMKQLPEYQKRQFAHLWGFWVQFQKFEKKDQVAERDLNLHTAGVPDLQGMFYTPYPEVAQIEFAQLPQSRREQWHDLAMHYLKVAQLAPEAESVKQCFKNEAISEFTQRVKPCYGQVKRYEHGYEFWTKKSTYRTACGAVLPQLREHMVDAPDFHKASMAWNRITTCVDQANKMYGMAATMTREAPAQDFNIPDAFYLRPTWLGQNNAKVDAKIRENISGIPQPTTEDAHH